MSAYCLIFEEGLLDFYESLLILERQTFCPSKQLQPDLFWELDDAWFAIEMPKS